MNLLHEFVTWWVRFEELFMNLLHDEVDLSNCLWICYMAFHGVGIRLEELFVNLLHGFYWCGHSIWAIVFEFVTWWVRFEELFMNVLHGFYWCGHSTWVIVYEFVTWLLLVWAFDLSNCLWICYMAFIGVGIRFK
jgi:hypothetical protein